MRGRPPRTAEDAFIQREVAESVLHENGLSRQDIHGVDRDLVAAHKRHDFVAYLRRFFDAYGRRGVVAGVSALTIFAAFLGVAGGSYGLMFVSGVLAGSAAGLWNAPDFVFNRPDAAFVFGDIEGDGLTDREVMRRLAIVQERDEYREELAEAERDANTQGKPTVNRM